VEPPEIDADAFNAFEASGWETKADGYDLWLGDITGRFVEPLLDAAGVVPGTRLLDLATGPGYAASAAAGRGASVVGIDIAAAMVALATRLHPELDFRQSDAHALPFDDSSFDAVVGSFLVLHLGRPEQAVAEAVRVLRSGGVLALTTWDVADRARMFGVFLDAVAEAGATVPDDVPPAPDFFRFSDDDEFDSLLGDHGLEERVIRTVGFTERVATVDDLWDGFLAGSLRVAALITGQPEETRRRIRAAFDAIVEDYRDGDALELPVSAKLASGRKP
jgi:SAM-dependent methyltransferase